MQNTQTADSLKIHDAAVKNLGIDASPNDLAPDELGCAETVTTIVHPLFQDVPIILGTPGLHDCLEASLDFVRVNSPLGGDIIVNPTAGKEIGHTGIFLTANLIASNSSATGKFTQNYTLDSWRQKFAGKLPEYIYRRV